jgi:hypothetical protein
MKCRLLITSLFLSIVTYIGAGIDSGGGKSTGGIYANHSSIGGSFMTLPAHGGTDSVSPGQIEVIYPITPSATTDVDENGLPDGWEILHFGALGVIPSLDADHDSTSNLLEYLAGTDPNNTASLFSPRGTIANGTFRMLIPTVIGREYHIWASLDLKNWSLQTILSGNNADQLFELDEANSNSLSR